MSVALACSWRSHQQQIVQALDGTDSNVCVVDLACGGMAVAMTTLTNLVSVYCLASKSCLSSLDNTSDPASAPSQDLLASVPAISDRITGLRFNESATCLAACSWRGRLFTYRRLATDGVVRFVYVV